MDHVWPKHNVSETPNPVAWPVARFARDKEPSISLARKKPLMKTFRITAQQQHAPAQLPPSHRCSGCHRTASREVVFQPRRDHGFYLTCFACRIRMRTRRQQASDANSTRRTSPSNGRVLRQDSLPISPSLSQHTPQTFVPIQPAPPRNTSQTAESSQPSIKPPVPQDT